MKTSKSLKWWQWETLLVTMVGYALYYVIRKNLSIAMPLLGEIGVSKVQLGAFLTCGGIGTRLDDGHHLDREPVFSGNGRGAVHQDAAQVVSA